MEISKVSLESVRRFDRRSWQQVVRGFTTVPGACCKAEDAVETCCDTRSRVEWSE